MRICGVIASLGGGGAERVMTELCAAWSARGDDVTLLTLDDGGGDCYPVPAGVTRIPLDLASRSASTAGAIRANVLRARALRRALQHAGADVIVSFTDRTNVLVLMAARGLAVPVVIAERIDPRRHDIGGAWNLLRRLLYPSAAALVVQTDAVRRWADDIVPSERVAVIPNPVRAVTSTRTDAGDRAPRIVALGRLVEQKGFDVLIQAFASIASEFPQWQLVIHGEGPDRSALEARIAALDLGARITLPGRTPHPDASLANAAIFALPSRYEGFPNALLEAMSHGCACVATDCDSGPADLIVSGHNGVLTPVNDVFSLAEGLATLMDDAALRTRVGRAATAVTEQFHAPRIVESWDRVFAMVRPPATRMAA
jgi:GalNAc-alpha-(1->4)-GalNAc-alpha-(1->3)-diNAcBac-PP-undecaprenol alpha-1,4-N-acetyl-D-galactosaminyltransferase